MDFALIQKLRVEFHLKIGKIGNLSNKSSLADAFDSWYVLCTVPFLGEQMSSNCDSTGRFLPLSLFWLHASDDLSPFISNIVTKLLPSTNTFVSTNQLTPVNHFVSFREICHVNTR